jgi:hypothetical protein
MQSSELWCYGVKPLHSNTRAHYFAYLSRYGHLNAEVTNLTPDDGHVWCPKHVEVIKLHILSHLSGSLHFTMDALVSSLSGLFQLSGWRK